MNIETLHVAGFEPAIHAMRNPMNSWPKSDSEWLEFEEGQPGYSIGPNDMDLSMRLQKSGPEHCKHLRMIHVWADITAPRYWEIEMDTYRQGVEKVSCSTMHKLMARPLTIDDFEHESEVELALESVVRAINGRMISYKTAKETGDEELAKEIWRSIIQLLPQSYLQKRTYMFSYAALRNIVRQREGHKLKEWKTFIEWARALPYSWMIFD